MTATIDGNLTVSGDLRVTGTASFANTSGIERADLAQDSLTAFVLTPETWRVHDNMDALLPDPPTDGNSVDDLGIVSGSFGTGTPSIQTGNDAAAASTTKRMRRLVSLPFNYTAGETVQIRLHAGMLTTVADNAATADVEAYKSDTAGGVSGSDLCATNAQSINNLVLADKDYTITATSLNPGDMLDVRVSVTVIDAATNAAVKAIIGKTALMCDTKG